MVSFGFALGLTESRGGRSRDPEGEGEGRGPRGGIDIAIFEKQFCRDDL